MILPGGHVPGVNFPLVHGQIQEHLLSLKWVLAVQLHWPTHLRCFSTVVFQGQPQLQAQMKEGCESRAKFPCCTVRLRSSLFCCNPQRCKLSHLPAWEEEKWRPGRWRGSVSMQDKILI